MASPISPSMMGGPPNAPPTDPTLSAIPMGGAGQGPAPGQIGALAPLIYQIEQQIKTVARILPDQSQALDQIVSDLRDVLAAALQGGGAPPAPTPNAGPPPPGGGSPFGGNQ